MPHGFGRLPFLARRGAAADRARTDSAAVPRASIDPDEAPVGPPVLLPATIHRMILVHATELTPAWARPRPAEGIAMTGSSAAGSTAPGPQPEATGTSGEPRAASSGEATAPKPTRRRKSSAGTGEPKAPAAPRNPRKPAGSRRRGSQSGP